MADFKEWDDIANIAKDVQSGKLSAVDLVNESLNRVESTKEYNAVLSTVKERALKRAKEIDAAVKEGKKVGSLAGVPFIAKDNFLTYGGTTTAASKILETFNAPYQSTAIEKLEAEGAICVAKANLDSFAHGGSTENSAFGPTLNPHDKTRVPGGSSGGSGAAMALKLASFALGTDTGGSVRLPASFCGVVGYKPTYGLVSRYGVVAMGSSTDVIGPFTKNVQDAALVLDVMHGRDKYDSTTIETQENNLRILGKPTLQGAKVGVIKEFMGDGVDDDVKKNINEQIEKIKNAGATINEVSIPSIDLALAVYYIIVPAELSSNLSRYDGQRYGLSVKDTKGLTDSYESAREQGFEPENKRRIMIGAYVLSSGYYDAYYKRAQTVRTKLIDEFAKVFEEVDYLVSPTAPSTAFKLGENTTDPLKMYLADVMTVATNLVGIPAINVPAGESKGLPIGIQFMSPQKTDKKLLEFALGYQELK